LLAASVNLVLSGSVGSPATHPIRKFPVRLVNQTEVYDFAFYIQGGRMCTCWPVSLARKFSSQVDKHEPVGLLFAFVTMNMLARVGKLPVLPASYGLFVKS
jgi:hypothetical protein